MICLTRPRRIGLTGGIGSGKSTVAAIFTELGVPALDLDHLGHRLVTTDTACLQQLVEAFGKRILQPDGALNRQALARHCFADAQRTTQLNRIMHPLIRRDEEIWLNRQKAEYVIIEASVLIESGGAERMDAMIVILAHEDIRLQRVLARGLQDADAFRAIMARQCTDSQRRQLADYIISNNDSLAELRKHVCQVHHALQYLTIRL